jgi:tripartite-type tricarboxylate transporter receptor subunit TctC
VLSDPDVQQRMVTAGLTGVIETPAALGERIKREQTKWKRVIEQIAK